MARLLHARHGAQVSPQISRDFLCWKATAPGLAFKHARDYPRQERSEAKREYGQLLNLHTRVLNSLREIRDHLVAPTTQEILAGIRRRTGSDPDAGLTEITTGVEQAIRALKLSEGRIRDEVMDEYENPAIEGVDNLPATLARFLGERQDLPGFKYEVLHDENRGWIIRWKEYTETGSVRGSGQFYERPYAWLDD